MKVIRTERLTTTTVTQILNNNCPDRKIFDLLSIDAERLDLGILKSIDFKKYLFNFLIVEDTTEIGNVTEAPIYTYLVSQGFTLLSKLLYSCIYYFDFSSENGKQQLRDIGIKSKPEFFNTKPWTFRFMNAVNEIKSFVPKNESFLFAFEDIWITGGEIAGRKIVLFTQNEGNYWGPPADDEAAILEIKLQKEKGASFIIFAWTCFWWIEYYLEMYNYLNHHNDCVLRSERLIIFESKEKN